MEMGGEEGERGREKKKMKMSGAGQCER